MTPDERTELAYLMDIMSEASKWNRQEGDDDSVRLEVQSRIDRILESCDDDGEDIGDPDPEPAPEKYNEAEPLTEDDYRAIEADRLNRHLTSAQRKAKKFRDTHVHLLVDGKYCYKLKEECHREKIPGFANRERWVWDGPKEAVDKLGDELWGQHELDRKKAD